MSTFLRGMRVGVVLVSPVRAVSHHRLGGGEDMMHTTGGRHPCQLYNALLNSVNGMGAIWVRLLALVFNVLRIKVFIPVTCDVENSHIAQSQSNGRISSMG